MIAGTSTCQMALSREPRFVPGVWGPYFGAVAPGLWLNEGGQSATGALLDHLLDWTAEGRALGGRGHDVILARIKELRAQDGAAFAQGLHVLPDFHGNRSPLADPKARGAISGLALDGSRDALARLYYAAAVAIALGNRHILERLGEHGYRIDHLHLTGGHVRNPLLVELYADASGCTVVLGEEEDGVLLGTAMVAAVAAGVYPSSPRRPPRWRAGDAWWRRRRTRASISTPATAPISPCRTTAAPSRRSWPRAAPPACGACDGRPEAAQNGVGSAKRRSTFSVMRETLLP
jgi:ribulose kinase